MYKLRRAKAQEAALAMGLIDQAKAFLKSQGIDQWQKGYPDMACIQRDVEYGKEYFMADANGDIAAYMCIDFDGEPAYDDLKGSWLTPEPDYVVVHRLAVASALRGRGLAAKAFALVQEMGMERGVRSIRVDTDEDNIIMKRVLNTSGYTYCGTICFDNSVKIAYEKIIRE